MDCGGTNMKLALVSAEGKIFTSQTIAINYNQDVKKSVQEMAEGVRSFLSENRIAKIKQIGVGIAGDVDSKNGVVRFSPNLNWTDVHFKEMLEAELKLNCFVQNDANCAAWGGYILDGKARTHNLICLTLGTGVGGGIILNDQLYEGVLGSAGELGHMSINYDGRVCKCGNIGCLESYLGAWGLILSAQELISKKRAPILSKLIKESSAKISPRLVKTAAVQGDPDCRRLWQQSGIVLGVALANLVNIFNPDLILLAGGVAKAGDLILKPALQEMRKRAFSTPAKHVQVKVSKLDQILGVAGAALLPLQFK